MSGNFGNLVLQPGDRLAIWPYEEQFDNLGLEQVVSITVESLFTSVNNECDTVMPSNCYL